MTSVQIPGDYSSLEAALAAGAMDILLSGSTPGGLVLSGPLRLRGGTIQGTGDVALRLSGDVELVDLQIINPDGDGVHICEGSPQLSGVSIEGVQVGIRCQGTSRAHIRGGLIESRGQGILIEDSACPELQGIRIQAEETALWFRDESGGRCQDVQVVSRTDTAVRICDRAYPQLQNLNIDGAQGCGVFIYGEANPHLRGLRVERCGLSGLEISNQARGVVIDTIIGHSASSAVLVSGRATPEICGIRVNSATLSGIEIKGEASPVMDGVHVASTSGCGLYIHGSARGTYMDFHLESCTLSSVEVKQDAHVDFEKFHLYSGQSNGLWVRDRAQVEALEFTIRRQVSIAVHVEDDGQLWLEDSVIKSNMDTGFQGGGSSRTEIKACDWIDNGGDGIVLMGSALCTIESGHIKDHHPGKSIRIGGRSCLKHAGFIWEGEVEVSPEGSLEPSV